MGPRADEALAKPYQSLVFGSTELAGRNDTALLVPDSLPYFVAWIPIVVIGISLLNMRNKQYLPPCCMKQIDKSGKIGEVLVFIETGVANNTLADGDANQRMLQSRPHILKQHLAMPAIRRRQHKRKIGTKTNGNIQF